MGFCYVFLILLNSAFSQITYGSVIKLMHEKTKVRLHSHDVPYGSGSGQQSVTGFPNVDDSNSYWVYLYNISCSCIFCFLLILYRWEKVLCVYLNSLKIGV